MTDDKDTTTDGPMSEWIRGQVDGRRSTVDDGSNMNAALRQARLRGTATPATEASSEPEAAPFPDLGQGARGTTGPGQRSPDMNKALRRAAGWVREGWNDPAFADLFDGPDAA